jgi:hypothetical protein
MSAGACAVSVVPKSQSNVRGQCCEQRVAISAPVEAVWGVLSAFSAWPAWNPLYVETAGTLAPGEVIAMTVLLPGMKPQRTHATVTAFEPPKLIEYSMRHLGGLIRVCRYIEVTATGPASCRVANGEIMGGPMGRLLARAVSGKLRQGLKAMNEGLKVTAEGAASPG